MYVLLVCVVILDDSVDEESIDDKKVEDETSKKPKGKLMLPWTNKEKREKIHVSTHAKPYIPGESGYLP